MKEYEVISDLPNLCGETPMWDHLKNEFYWSDMLGKVIYNYNPNDGSIKKIAEGKNVSGFTMNKGGGFVCASHQGIYIWDKKNGFQFLMDEFEGNKLNCNDATADIQGRFLFGSTFYDPNCLGGDYPLGKLYKIEKDGTIAILEEGLHLSNGLGFSPDNKTFYCTDTVLREILAYDYDPVEGQISNRRTLIKVPKTEGIPDGLTVDTEGYLWSAQWYGSCFVRYDPDGKMERRIATPAWQTSSLVFGGKDLMDIFVTSAALSIKLHCAPKGYNFEAGFVGGPVYKYNFKIQGKAEYFADIHIQ